MHLFDTPFLLIHGKEDVVTSPQMSQHLYDVAVVCLRPLPRMHSVVRAVALPSWRNRFNFPCRSRSMPYYNKAQKTANFGK